MKKLASKITAVLVAAGLMFPAGTICNIDFGLTAFAEETAEGYTNGFCTDYEADGVCETHTGCNGYQPATDSDSDGVYEIGNAGQLYWFADKVNNENATYGSANAVLTDNITVNEGVLDASGNLVSDTSGFRSWTPIGTSAENQFTGIFDGNDKTISGLYYNVTISGSIIVRAGLFGRNAGTIKNVSVKSSYFGLILSNAYCYFGGLCGFNIGTIENCYNEGTITVMGTSTELAELATVGGVSGSGNGTIKNSHNKGKVTVTASKESYVGGVKGCNTSTIENCSNTGEVSGIENVGGVCGYNYADSGSSKIESCSNTGTVSGTYSVGGVCGYNYATSGGTVTITNCYNTGTVSGTYPVGGVCGFHSPLGNNIAKIENSYSTGAVSGTSSVGGVCGAGYDDNISGITNCYYLSGTAEGGIGGADNEANNVVSKTAGEFGNGSVCYLLNGSTSTNPVWYQTLDSEAYPNLDSTNSASRTVYQCTPCTVVFSNTEGQTAEHSCVVDTNDSTKHICEKCGETHDAEFTADDTADTISICHGFGSVTLKAPTENLTYDGTAKAATYTGEIKGFDTPEILYKLKGSAEAATDTAPTNAGTYVASITYTDEGSVNHTVRVEYTIKQAELTVSAGDFKVSKVYDGTTAAGTGNDGKFEISGLVGTDTVTITPTIGAYSSADIGTSNVTVTISLTDASGKYTLGNTTVSVPAEITPRSITPICLVLGNYTYTGSPIIPEVIVQTGGALGGVQPKVYEKDKDYTITVTDNINAGTGKVTFKPVSGGNYTFDEQTLDFTINKGTPTITADPTAKAGLVYKGTAQELISAGSTDFGTLLYSLDGTTYSTSIPTATNAGEYTVYYKVQGDSNVDDTAAVSITASIGKAAATITAESYTIKVGSALPTYKYTVTGLVNNDTLPIDVTISCNAADINTAGTHTITVSGAENSTNYTFAYVNGTLTITDKEIQTITAADVTFTYGETGKKIAATTSGDGKITYSVKTGSDVISVAENGTITAVKAGTAIIEITATATDTYEKASKTVFVKVNKAAVTIKANSYSVYVGDELPTFGYTVTGLVSGDSLNFTPVLSCAEADTSTVNTYTITITINTAEDEKYTYTTQNGTLSVNKKSSGGTSGGSGGGSSGGSSGGGSYRPTTPTTTNPSIGGSAKSWSDVAADLGKLTNGSEATIELNGSTTVPVDVIKAIATSNAEVTLKVDDVFSWTIDGSEMDAKDANSANLSIIKTTVVADNTPRGTRGTSFSIKGTNVKSELNINFKKTHSDEFANLFKKVDGKLVFVDNVKVDKNGAAIGLDASEKGEYVVMLGEFSDRPGDMDNDGVLNAKDALAALKNSVGIEAGKNPLVGDINGDGYINAKDALIILKKSVGMA